MTVPYIVHLVICQKANDETIQHSGVLNLETLYPYRVACMNVMYDRLISRLLVDSMLLQFISFWISCAWFYVLCVVLFVGDS